MCLNEIDGPGCACLVLTHVILAQQALQDRTAFRLIPVCCVIIKAGLTCSAPSGNRPKLQLSSDRHDHLTSKLSGLPLSQMQAFLIYPCKRILCVSLSVKEQQHISCFQDAGVATRFLQVNQHKCTRHKPMFSFFFFSFSFSSVGRIKGNQEVLL